MYMNEEYKKHVTSISTHKFIFMIKVMYKTNTKKLTILTLVTVNNSITLKQLIIWTPKINYIIM